MYRNQSPEDSSACEGGRGRDDDSEASSVCSERSLDSYRRHDANYLNSGRLLTDDQLRRLTELLNKMFVDAHTKVFSLLLDAVCELLLVHWQQLKDWLYQLMFREFNSSQLGRDKIRPYETDENGYVITKSEAVKVLIWLCRRPETRPQWQDYFDLILLKLIHAYESLNKEVMRAVEAGMPHIANALPAQQLADHQNSAVRKAAVFCMVAFTFALGEERMQPHLKHLSVSKYRLLQVYISKQREESPRGGGAPPSAPT
ncbi:hypothetical protein HF086_003933 [Spodoptera exigua]|uniref:Uncharacterized protein n=1 Tax=Spodoptera exigua TaxID=7107 RepID=A0A922MAM1_SPOEX|nr:hypothetical protein HF086_003933 [Spodoptera exigua]